MTSTVPGSAVGLTLEDSLPTFLSGVGVFSTPVDRSAVVAGVSHTPADTSAVALNSLDASPTCSTLFGDDDEMPPLEEIFPIVNNEKPSNYSRDLVDIMSELQQQIDNDLKANICNVDRSDVLDGGFRCFQKQKFNPRARISVRFAGEKTIATSCAC